MVDRTSPERLQEHELAKKRVYHILRTLSYSEGHGEVNPEVQLVYQAVTRMLSARYFSKGAERCLTCSATGKEAVKPASEAQPKPSVAQPKADADQMDFSTDGVLAE